VGEKRRPLSYWDDLREETAVVAEMSISLTNTSSVISVMNDSTRSRSIRLAHLLSIMPSSHVSDGKRTPTYNYIYLEAAGFLAMHHFNERTSSVLPNLPERLGSCNVYLTMDMKDSMFSPVQAARHLFNANNDVTHHHSLQRPKPVSILGSYRSAVSFPLSVLSGALGIPHMNCASTSSVMDNKDQSPTFMRTVPTNAVDAEAAVLYFRDHLQISHFGVLFVRDAYGSQFASDLGAACATNNITMTMVSYEDGDMLSIRNAMQMLKNYGLRYLFGVISAAPTTIKLLVNEAKNAGIMGNSDYSWLFAEGGFPLMEPGFYQTTLQASVKADRDIARAISGAGFIILSPARHIPFEQAMAEMGNDKELVDYYISKHDHPATFDGFDFQSTPHLYQYLNYDAVMALGIALCDAEEEFIKDEELLHQVKSTQFDGVSGPVSFHPVTGTRMSDGVSFAVINLLVTVSDHEIRFESRSSASIDLSTGNIDVISPFIYADDSTIPPLEMPKLEQDFNLVPLGVRAFIWSLSGLVILLSIGFALWTYRYRNKNIVRAAQPLFLFMSCVGTLLMAASIIPMSLQEPVSETGLDIACMAVPWLFITGFGTASSSLLCKSIRINSVFTQSLSMRRVTIKPRDVLFPFVLITSVNTLLLLCWTLVAPSEWIRSDLDNFDKYGRSIESVGYCGYNEEGSQRVFICILLFVNVVYTIIGNYQSYLTRNMPSDFNETFYIALSMASILESFLIGIPILFVSTTIQVDLTVQSVLVAFLCLAIQFPLFVAKLMIRNHASQNVSRSNRAAAWNTTFRRRSTMNLSNPSLSGGTLSGGTLSGGTEGRRRSSTTTGDTIGEIRARVASGGRTMARRNSLVCHTRVSFNLHHQEDGLQNFADTAHNT
jgi:ABC-type branched-subunit amino acid transport system substrate-binding protein